MSVKEFSTNKSEKRWVHQLREHFIIYIENPPSIFRVSTSLRDTNPESYIPQHVGIGAYHHFHIDNRKLEALKEILKPEQYKNFSSLIVDRVQKLEPAIRSCYNKYLDLDGETLAWSMSIDGVYLLHLLNTYSGIKASVGIGDRNLAPDIMMLENQMPCIVLEAIKNALQLPCGNELIEKDHEIEENKRISCDNELFLEILSFCKAHSPLDLPDDAYFEGDTASPHFLHYMYTLIVKNWSIGDTMQTKLDVDVAADYELSPLVGGQKNPTRPHFARDICYVFTQICSTFEEAIEEEVTDEVVVNQFIECIQKAAGMAQKKSFKLIANLPLEQIANLFENGNHRSRSVPVEEIRIPSVSTIHNICKIKFRVWPYLGIGIKYDDQKKILYLPVIRLNTDSEVILRNLVAYEIASRSSNLVMVSYVDFMCGIINTPADVELLKKKGIIISDLASAEIAETFNGIRKSARMRSDVEETVQKLQMISDSTFSVKACTFIKDHLIPSKSTVTCILSILMVLLLTFQSFCDIYDCHARSSGMMIINTSSS